eukprot:scaffold70622_cov17-Tisochrysis_lutea.AAC.1
MGISDVAVHGPLAALFINSHEQPTKLVILPRGIFCCTKKRKENKTKRKNHVGRTLPMPIKEKALSQRAASLLHQRHLKQEYSSLPGSEAGASSNPITTFCFVVSWWRGPWLFWAN